MSIYSTSIFIDGTHQKNSEPAASKAWLVSFTDLVMLMLSFFVMLYAMSDPSDTEWEQIKTALSMSNTPSVTEVREPSAEFNAEAYDTVRNDNTQYLYSVLTTNIDQRGLQDKVQLTFDGVELVISLSIPEMFNSKGRLSDEAQTILMQLAPTLKKATQEIELVGHEAPLGSQINKWQSGLYRSYLTSLFLKEKGVEQELVLSSVSDTHFGRDKLTNLNQTDNLSRTERFKRAQRVDIVIGSEGGRQ